MRRDAPWLSCVHYRRNETSRLGFVADARPVAWADVRWLHPRVARVKAVTMAEEHGAEARVPVEQALYGLEVHPLPQGWTPISAIVLVKCLDEDGEPTWAFRTTDGLNDEELLGTLTVRTDLLRRELVDSYYDGDD